jgi:cysteine-rich repeat protein
MMRPSSSAFTITTLALLASAGLASCGGETDLNFVGMATGGGGGSSGKGGSGGGDPNTICGDGVVDADEECDDSSDSSGDGCSSSCAVEDGWTCSGEPSECVACGNETVEGEEECDDGNTDNGDGCSSMCTVEGSCAAPTVIELEEDGEGLSGTASSVTGEDDLNQVDVEACGGDDAGGGADRIFQFELPEIADVDVRVGSNFDAIVRVMSSACDLADELPGACADDGAVAAEERVRIPSAPAGTYYVVVDGKNAGQSGTFSVDVEVHCPLEGLKLNRVILEAPFRTEIVNTNASCSIDLMRVGLASEPEATDTPSPLSGVVLGPLGRRTLTSEDPAPAGTIYQGNLQFDADDYAGALYLCRGPCTATGSNVIDAFRWQGDSGAPSTDALSAVQFDNAKGAIDVLDRPTMSYWRVNFGGVFPNFVANDWDRAYFVETFEGDLAGWTPFADLFYDPTFEAVEGAIGRRALALTGGNPSAGVWNGPKYGFKDHTGATANLQPTSVSLWIRGSDKTLNHGSLFFGDPGGAEDDGFGSLFRNNGTLGFGSPAIAVSMAYNANTWYFVEYKDFDYTVPGSETATVYVDGVAKGTLDMTIPTVSQLSIRNLDETTAWIDQIIVK